MLNCERGEQAEVYEQGVGEACGCGPVEGCRGEDAYDPAEGVEEGCEEDGVGRDAVEKYQRPFHCNSPRELVVYLWAADCVCLAALHPRRERG